jgi:NADPH-dependent curcumin reductase CurA
LSQTKFDSEGELGDRLDKLEKQAITNYLSIDPTNRIWMSDMEQYMPPVAIGEVMRGGGMGRVVASNSGHWQVADIVGEYCLVREGGMFAPRKVPRDLPIPLSAMLGACGTTGITAYFGLLDLCQPKSGETVWSQRLPGQLILSRAKSPRSRAVVQ